MSTPETRSIRRLAAILASDVVGYSRMMAADESATLAALKRHREVLFDPTVATNNGRIVKLIGDGALVEFGSVVDAVKCALAVQRAIAAEPATGPRITLRIGINLGDVIIEGDDIYGDGVNVAARLEPLAEPGGVCVASIVNESIGNRIDVAFKDAGDVHVKNIDRPIRVWKWHPGAGSSTPSAPAAVPGPAKPDKPSIAVLPFTNMSGDAEQEYFSDGISEDIITDLSKVAGLLVIARNSTFAYKGKSVDIRMVGRELGVTSVLEGSIRKAGNRVRITAQLIDARDGTHLWADRYDRDLTDIFAVQDEVTDRIVSALKVTLTPKEKELIQGGGTTNAEAHDYVLRARQLLTRPNRNREVFEESVALLERAIAIDPAYSEAYAALAMSYNLDYQNAWSADCANSLSRAKANAEKAVATGPDEAYGHYIASIIHSFDRNLERADAEVEKALALSPNFAMAINARGATDIFRGDSARAIPNIERAMRLDPSFSHQYLHFLGTAYLLTGKYETAAAQFRERILIVPETDVSRAFLASALGHLDRVDEAQAVWRELARVNPRYSFEAHMRRMPFHNPADPQRIREGLAKAGLPGDSLA